MDQTKPPAVAPSASSRDQSPVGKDAILDLIYQSSNPASSLGASSALCLKQSAGLLESYNTNGTFWRAWAD